MAGGEQLVLLGRHVGWTWFCAGDVVGSVVASSVSLVGEISSKSLLNVGAAAVDVDFSFVFNSTSATPSPVSCLAPSDPAGL